MNKYHFHFKCSSFPYVFAELCFNSEKNYGQFEYLVLQDGDLLTGYCSEKGFQDQYKYGIEHLFDFKKEEIFNKISELDSKILSFIGLYKDSANRTDYGRQEWLKFYLGAREILKQFGEIYFVMESMALEPLAEFIEKICARDGLLQDQVLHDITVAKKFSLEEKRLVEVLNRLGREKLALHDHISPVIIILYELFDYIARQTKFPINEVIMISDKEVIGFLESGVIDENSLKSKSLGTIFLTGQKYSYFKVCQGQEYRKWREILEPEFKGEIKGTVACRGKITGRVSLHLSWLHTTVVPAGNILVAGMTNPQMVPFIKNVGGIVTDEGGLTCHAAIIAREMKKPCSIGTKIATRVLKDGDLVEVDAEKGVVRILKRE